MLRRVFASQRRARDPDPLQCRSLAIRHRPFRRRLQEGIMVALENEHDGFGSRSHPGETALPVRGHGTSFPSCFTSGPEPDDNWNAFLLTCGIKLDTAIPKRGVRSIRKESVLSAFLGRSALLWGNGCIFSNPRGVLGSTSPNMLHAGGSKDRASSFAISLSISSS